MTSKPQPLPADAGRLDRMVGRLEPERASACGLTECAGKPMRGDSGVLEGWNRTTSGAIGQP